MAQKYCPEEVQQKRQETVPDETLHLEALGLTMASPLPLEGLGEAELRHLHYEEADTLNSEEIKKDFPVLHQKVNGHDLVWLDKFGVASYLLTKYFSLATLTDDAIAILENVEVGYYHDYQHRK